jgi:hypothetical protein
MIPVVLLAVGLLGQVPPPPAPAYSPADRPSVDQSPSEAQAKREWLLAHLIVDMQMQGQYDAKKYHEIETMLEKMSPSQLGVLVQYYQQRKSRVEAWQSAEANLRRLEAYRDHLKRELEWKLQTYQQERAITQYSSQLAQQMFLGQLGQFYAAQAWPYYYRPHYYSWASSHYHHRHW